MPSQIFLTHERNDLGLMAASECQRSTVEASLRAVDLFILCPINRDVTADGLNVSLQATCVQVGRDGTSQLTIPYV